MAKLARATEEKDFLKSLSDGLLSNQKTLQEQLRAAEAASRDAAGAHEAHVKARLRFAAPGWAARANSLRSLLRTAAQDLEEQVRDLMVFIEAQRAVEGAGSGELRDGAVVAVKSPQSAAEAPAERSPAAALRTRLEAKAGDRRRK